MKRKPLCIKILLSLFFLLAALALALLAGTEKISLTKALFSPERPNFDRIILVGLRLPRALLALVTGILLGGTGAAFQLYFRNPLAEPGIMGISSGATLGAVTAQVFGISAAGLAISSVNLAAFLGALAAGGVVTALAAGATKKDSTVMLLLCGTALGTLYSSVSSMILLTSDKELHSIYTWILGSFNGRGWRELAFILLPSAASLLVLALTVAPLDLLCEGEETALALGVDTGRLRLLVIISGALAASAAVCAGGTIGFVGLIAPHIVRRLFGPKARLLIPMSMISGSILLLLADTLARVIIAPSELPTGVLTSILGVPFFLSLLAQGRAK